MSKMSLMKEITKLVQVLETYRGKDRFVRLATYGAMFMIGTGKSPRSEKWKTVSAEMGGCRVILRLFDDLSMLLLNLSTGFGLKGTRPSLKALELFTSLLNQIFYPVEHIGWLRQKKVLNGPPGSLLFAGLAIWAATLTAEIMKSFIKLRIMASQARQLVKQQQLDKDSGNSAQNSQIKENLEKLKQEKNEVLLSMVQTGCDLTNAISWFPSGFLWGQKFSPSTNGVFGIIATFISLYRNWPTKITIGS